VTTTLKNRDDQQRVVMRVPFVTTTATTTVHVMPLDRPFEIDRVDLLVGGAGLAADADNHFAIALRCIESAHDLASVSTATTSLDGDEWSQLTLPTNPESRRALAGHSLALVFEEIGNASLPAGTVVISGRYRS
jgi:hypothetical protein